MSKTRFQMTVRLPDEVRDALDRRVEELRSRGVPVERAALAAGLLARAVGPEGGPDVEAIAAAVTNLEHAARNLAGRGALTAEHGASLSRALSGLAETMRKALGAKGGA